MSTKKVKTYMRKGDSFSEYPTYIKHWEEAKPWGWEIRIATEGGTHTIHLKWKDYKRPHELTKRKGDSYRRPVKGVDTQI